MPVAGVRPSLQLPRRLGLERGGSRMFLSRLIGEVTMIEEPVVESEQRLAHVHPMVFDHLSA